MNKWRVDEHSFGNVSKPQSTTHNFCYMETLGSRGELMPVGLLALCTFAVTLLLVKQPRKEIGINAAL